MPPVRWKVLILVCSIYLTNKSNTSNAQLQDAISMSSDGWRPIVGFAKQYHQQEITNYRNPSEKNDASTTLTPPPPPPPTPPQPKSTQKTQKPQLILTQKPQKPILVQKQVFKPKDVAKLNINNPQFKKHVTKVIHQHPQQYFINHGPHIPLGGAIQHTTRPVQFKKHTTKPHTQNGGGKIRVVKPVRVQSTAQSNRNEVFVAPPNTGSYSFISHGPISNVKQRDTQEYTLLGNSRFINHHPLGPNLNNRFAIPNGEQIFQSFGNSPTVQGFLFTKPPHTNEVHFPFNQNQNDEYTRNLVPPPLYKKNKAKENVIPVTEQPVQHQFIKPSLPDNVVVQVPPPFEQSFALNTPNVEVSKEKLKVFHNRIPPNYNLHTPDYTDYDYFNVKTPAEIKKTQTYEVTEGKQEWQDIHPPPFNNFRQQQRTKKPNKVFVQPQVELNLPPFLPTPYRPDKVVPTSATQNEVSTVFTQVSSKMNKYRKEVLNNNPLFFDVKEVSTHYPILGKPEPTLLPNIEEMSNEITTNKGRDPTRTRLNQRRRRPTRPSTTSTTTEEPSVPATDKYEPQKSVEEVETERPHRRRPSGYRSTTERPSIDSESHVRNRYRGRGNQRKRIKPTEMPVNHKVSDGVTQEPSTEAPVVKFIDQTRKPSNTQEEYQNEEETYVKRPNKYKYELPNGYYESQRYDSYEDGSSEPATDIEKRPETIETTKISIDTTADSLQTSVPTIPENEVDYPTSSTTQKAETTLATTIPTTSTTTEASTTKSNRLRGRPVKYDTSNRPRFSVKDYRQRLNQYTSTSTTESSRSTTDSNRLNRYSSRLRTRPTLATTTTAASETNEEHSDSIRSRFKPKDPRHSAKTENPNESIITEKNVKAINTRLRPFGRYRSTTELPSTTPKVSIKPNLFAQRRRPPQLSLRTRINNKLNKTNEEKSTTMAPEEDASEPNDSITSTLAYDTNEEASTPNESTEIPSETTSADIMKSDAMIYSQRVSDLTSSFQNEYNTPGLFKSVSPTSRRIPNHFTISTDEPKLPIEAFFPNLMDKEKDEE